MENELLKFMQAVRDLHDEPCDKHRENLREVLSLEPAAAECPEVWRSSLGQEATPYLDGPPQIVQTAQKEPLSRNIEF